MFDGNNIQDLFKKAQELSQNLQSQQEELAKKSIDVSVGGGMVKMTFNGKMEALSVNIDPEIANREELDMLQDLVLSAVNEGVRQTQKLMQEEMGKNLGGLKIPGLNL